MNPTPVSYVDGWPGGVLGRQLTVVPRPQFPFAETVTPERWTRLYERDFEVVSKGYLSRMSVRTSWTNLLKRSEDFTQSDWMTTNVTPSVTTNDAPNGDSTMGKLLETSATGEHSIAQAATVTAAPTEISIFALGGLTRRRVKLSFTDSDSTVFSAVFDFVSGQYFSATANTTAKVVPLGDGFFELVLQFTPASGAGTFKAALVSTGTTTSYAGSTSAGGYFWGAQVVTGADAPYISTTSATRSILAPDRDTVDPFAYLIGEKDPVVVNSEYSTVKRTFCRIPRQQVVPDSLFVKKPDIPGTFPQVSGNSLIVQPEANVERWLFFTQNAVTSDSGIPDGAHPTGGTYLITAIGSTTSPLAFNAIAATVQSTLNALPSVSGFGSYNVTGSYTSGLSITWAGYASPTIDTSGLTGAGISTYTYVGASASIYNATGQNIAVLITALGGGGAPPPPNSAQFTGGTIKITIFGQTTGPIPYNGTISDVQSALLALSNVPAGTTVRFVGTAGYISPGIFRHFGPYVGDQIGFIIDLPAPSLSANGSALTPAGSNVTTSVSGLTTQLAFTGVNLGLRVLSVPGHTISEADQIILTQGANFRILAPGSFTVGTDTITLNAASGVAFSDSTPITAVGKQTGQTYTADTKYTRVKIVTDFYLIGVSPGVNSLDDIPLPTYEGDPASMLAAIFAADTDINYQVGGLRPWRNGPFVMRERTTLNAATL